MGTKRQAREKHDRPWQLVERTLAMKKVHPDWDSMKIARAVIAQLREEKVIGPDPNIGCGRTLAKEKSVAASMIKPDVGEEDGKDFEFEEKLLTKRKLREFGKEKGIPFPVIVELIEAGKLKARKLPGYSYEKFSTRQLGILLRNYNKLF